MPAVHTEPPARPAGSPSPRRTPSTPTTATQSAPLPPPPYNLRDLSAPTLSGLPQRLFTHVLESPRFGRGLRRRLQTRSGFTAFRAQKHLDADELLPRIYPLHTPVPPPRPPPSHARLDALLATLRLEGPRASAADYARAYSSGVATPTRIAELILGLVAESNAGSMPLNAVGRLDAQATLVDAAASTARWARGAPRSTFDGVPFTVKDSLDARGYVTRNGSGHFEALQEAARLDAPAVAALRDAGMVLVGKCNQDELGVGVRGFSAWTGQIRNPHNMSYVPGGSSGGDAAAVATGFVPFSVGTDAGGSVRIPAACCGVYGIKPTFGRVSARGRALVREGHVSSVTHVGGIAACAADLIAVYYLLAGFAPHESAQGLECPALGVGAPATLARDVRGLRVGVYKEWTRSADGECVGATERFLDALRGAGAHVLEVAVPELEETRVSLSICLMRELAAAGRIDGAFAPGDMTRVGWDARAKLAVAQEFDAADERRARVVRGRAMVESRRIFGQVDVIVTPALGVTTPPVPRNLVTGMSDVGTDSRMMKFMAYGNLTGLPACTIPIGRDMNGLPLGVQVIAGAWQEETLLRVCLWAEREFNVAQEMCPDFFYNALIEAQQVV